MQTAYARFVRLSRLISRWGRHWRRRRSVRNVPAAVTSRPAVRIHRVGVGSGERIALVGRMSDVCAELDRLALRERRRA